MKLLFPEIYLVRHGETDWSISGQHTGLTDLPLTPSGERNAHQLGKPLQELSFVRVFTSPLQRARRTCDFAGFSQFATVDEDLVEWNYGDYEGKTTTEIHEQRPDWNLFRDGCPGGETVSDVGRRADRVIHRLRIANGNVLLFSSAHFLRVLAARWLGLDPMSGQYFLLDAAALSIIGYDHNLNDPVIRLWNDRHHTEDNAA